MDPKELEDLLERIKHGSEQAATSFILMFTATIHRTVRSLLDPQLESRVTCDEIVQEVLSDFFLHLLAGAPCPDAAALPQYLIRSAHNKVYDAHREHHTAQQRSRGRERALPADLPERGPSREQHVDFRDELEHDLRRLSPRERDTVTLLLDSSTHAQVATTLHITVRMVTNILDRLWQRGALSALGRPEGGR